MYQYGWNNPVLMSDPNGLWPGEGLWKKFTSWLNKKPSGNNQSIGEIYSKTAYNGKSRVPQTNGQFLFDLLAASLNIVAQERRGSLGATKAVLKSPKGSTVASVATRATEIHLVVQPATQRRTTIAVADSRSIDGTAVRLVGSNENKLRPAQIQALLPGEVAVTGPGHAEVTVLNYANANGLIVGEIAASRPICANCAITITNSGASPASPIKIKHE